MKIFLTYYWIERSHDLNAHNKKVNLNQQLSSASSLWITMVGICWWQNPTMAINDKFPPWWDFVMVGICRKAIIITTKAQQRALHSNSIAQEYCTKVLQVSIVEKYCAKLLQVEQKQRALHDQLLFHARSGFTTSGTCHRVWFQLIWWKGFSWRWSTNYLKI